VSQAKRILIQNSTHITPEREIAGHTLAIDGERIEGLYESTPEGFEQAEIIDGSELYVSPGFIDTHIQGCLDHDVWEVEKDGVQGLAQAVPQFGCTALVATTHYDEKHLPLLVERVARKPAGAQILGLQFEGPFVNPKRVGALAPQTPLPVSVDSAKRIIDLSSGFLRLLTIAPELPGALDVIRFMKEQGVVVSLGHSETDFETAREAVRQGVTMATHCFNAMRPFDHREPGTVGASLLSDEITVQIITDNHHLHPATYDLVARAKPWGKIAVATDSIRVAGMPPGRYDAVGDGRLVNLKDGAVKLDDGRIAGSALTMNLAIRNFGRRVGCSLAKAIQLATLNPARVMGVDHYMGRLEPGYQADVVLFDKDLNVRKTLVRGTVVFEA